MRECVLWIRYYNFRPCEDPVAVLGREEVIDLRVLQTQVGAIQVVDRRNKDIKRMEAQLRYAYQPSYGETLGRSEDAANRILEDEYQRYPNNVLMRLKAVQDRYDTELNIKNFDGSYKRTRYCSRLEIQVPKDGGAHYFHIGYELADRFVRAFDEYSQTCLSVETS